MAKLKHSPFLKLPRELRDIIYHQVLLGSPRQDALAYDIDSSILRTCKQIHAEARPILFKVNVFEAAIWIPIEGKYTPWPALPSNQVFLSRVQHLALYWDMRQFESNDFIRFESVRLRDSILNLKRICMALLQAGTNLRSLRVTMKVPGRIDFTHMPLGQYPFLHTPIYPPGSLRSHDPDALAPLKELRVQRVMFSGDFSEATAKTMAYLEGVKAIMEGFKPTEPWIFPETKELNLDLMSRRSILYFCSPVSHPSWEGILHRELYFYAETLRTFHVRNADVKDESNLAKELDSIRLMLSSPVIETTKGHTTMDLGRVLLLLEEIFQYLMKLIHSYRLHVSSQGLLAARQYLFVRVGIRKTMQDAILPRTVEDCSTSLCH